MLLAALLFVAHPLHVFDQCAAPPTDATIPVPGAPASGASAATQYGPHAASDQAASRSRGPWVTRDDYPPAALRARQEGTVLFALDIDGRGCPAKCTITRSSGFAALDDATCPILMKRARFTATPGIAENAIVTTWRNRFQWEIP